MTATRPPFAPDTAVAGALARSQPPARSLEPRADVADTPAATSVLCSRVARQGVHPARAVLEGVASVTVGAASDTLFSDGAGLGLTIGFLVACAVMSVRVRMRSLAAAVLSGPLLFAAAIGVISWLSPEAQGFRHLVLDVATTLALSAPVLFSGTALTVVVAVVRLCTRLVARSR